MRRCHIHSVEILFSNIESEMTVTLLRIPSGDTYEPIRQDSENCTGKLNDRTLKIRPNMPKTQVF